MKNNCPTCSKVVGILRVLLGLGILYHGILKLMAGTDMAGFIGGAAHDLGLTFLSLTTWFWIVTVAELLAGISLVMGRWYKLGALLVLIIMAVAIIHVGPDWKNVLFAIVSIILLIKGPGARAACKGASASPTPTPDDQKE